MNRRTLFRAAAGALAALPLVKGAEAAPTRAELLAWDFTLTPLPWNGFWLEAVPRSNAPDLPVLTGLYSMDDYNQRLGTLTAACDDLLSWHGWSGGHLGTASIRWDSRPWLTAFDSPSVVG